MNDLFAGFYESVFGIYNEDYYLIYNALLENGGYMILFAVMVALPVILMGCFYLLWKYPYGKMWHWLVWVLFVVIATAGTSYFIADYWIFSSSEESLNQAIQDLGSGYNAHAMSLPFKYALHNGIISLVVIVIASFFYKRASKIQTHLPV